MIIIELLSIYHLIVSSSFSLSSTPLSYHYSLISAYFLGILRLLMGNDSDDMDEMRMMQMQVCEMWSI
jgi:hypothetical protein